MKRNIRIRILGIITNLILVICFLIFVVFMTSIIDGKNGFGLKNLLQITITSIFGVCFFIATLSLKKIIKSINDKDPFNLNNIKNFQTIGYCFLTITIIDAIANYTKPSATGIKILANSYGSIKPIFLLYLILGIVSFVLGDIFRMAIEIKDENDLTV